MMPSDHGTLMTTESGTAGGQMTVPASEVTGYSNISHELSAMPISTEVLHLGNNTLGPYGMYMHAFEATRGRFDYYIYCEDDYVPARPHFDAAMVRMYEETFPRSSGGGGG